MKRLTELQNFRQEILEALGTSVSPLQMLDLSKKMRIKAGSDEYEYMRDLLELMVDEGIVQRMSRRRYTLPHRTSSDIHGVLSYHHNNAVVTTRDESVPVIAIRRHDMNTALSGDTVVVQMHAIAPGKKPRGEVLDIVQRAAHVITGTIEHDGTFFYVIPDDVKYHIDFLVAEQHLNGAKPGDKVSARFHRWRNAQSSPEVTIAEVIGRSGKAAVEFAAILKEFRLPKTFPPEVEAEALGYAHPDPSTLENRRDIRDLRIVTIDPEDARDFDDALSLTHLDNGNIELGVHIADVSHYVQEGSALDKEALQRGNSTYLVDCVVPMLPERLSNDICSLVPNQPRCAYSVFMEFSPTGIRRSYRIEETLIQSCRRYTYDEAQSIIEGADGDHADLIHELHALARKLFTRRMKAGGIDFETQEIKFILDAEKMPSRAVVKTRTHATSLVEECMLAANRTVAEHLHALKKEWNLQDVPPFVYRVHDKPSADKIADATNVIRALGFDVPSGQLSPLQINAVLEQAANRPDKPVVNTLLLRSMAKAVYAEYNIGHYGLGFADYSHFTSPIRRYPDLVVHRFLKEYSKGLPEQRRMSKLRDLASYASDHCSLTERQSVEAERASTKLAQTILAHEHVGSDHVGYVTGVTQFGVFITLHDLMIEGLLHLRDFDDDYYIFDDRRMRIIGRNSRRVVRYGTQLRVRIVKANIDRREIDLRLSKDQSGIEQTVELVEREIKKPKRSGRRGRES
jgi:ribonuclease R